MLSVERSGDQLLVADRAARWVRGFTWFVVVIAAVSWLIFAIAVLGGTQHRTVKCARSSGRCVVNGGESWSVAIGDIEGVEVVTTSGGAARLVWHVRGKKTAETLTPSDAHGEASVAAYRAAAATLTAFLDDPAQERAGVSFAFQVSLGEKIRGGGYALCSLLLIAAMMTYSRTVICRFDAASRTVSVAITGPLRRRREQSYAFDRIVAVVDSQPYRARWVALRLADEKPLWLTGTARFVSMAALDDLSARVAEIVGKPLERIGKRASV